MGFDDEATTTGSAASAIAAGDAVLGIELGSTRIKACLVDADHPAVVFATGAHEWENELVDGVWSYSLDAVEDGIRAAYAALAADVRARFGVPLERIRAVGVSAMMHGYLAFDVEGALLVPFRTWRNTSTSRAAAELTELLGANIPLRWSIAHHRQAMLDDEPHVGRVAHLTTLAGYVHERLTGHRVLGVGDASGMFPIDATTGGWDAALIARFDERAGGDLGALLPDVLRAGAVAGELTDDGAAWLDPAGALRAGAIAAPPEGDAGTGMVATDAVAPRTGNVSAGTSIFAMVVLEHPLERVHEEIDVVATPTGAPVAMVHCNNGASELAAWASVFSRFAGAIGSDATPDAVYAALFAEALAGAADADGVLAYNQLAGEPVAGLAAGRPMIVRTPDSRLTLANLMRAQLYGVFASLAMGMRTLDAEGVAIDALSAHGGVFRTAGVAQRFLAAALDVPISVAETASEGGAWGMAVLAAYTASGASEPLAPWLTDTVFAGGSATTTQPDPADVQGFGTYLARYAAGLPAVRAAADTLV